MGLAAKSRHAPFGSPYLDVIYCKGTGRFLFFSSLYVCSACYFALLQIPDRCRFWRLRVKSRLRGALGMSDSAWLMMWWSMCMCVLHGINVTY